MGFDSEEIRADPRTWTAVGYSGRSGCPLNQYSDRPHPVELGFALALSAAATGLTLWLGLAERRRTFAIAAALGANRRQLGAFVWAEAGIITLAGLASGAVAAWALSNMLVKVLHGVFDPAPASLAIPWPYLGVVLAITLGATALAAIATIRSARTPHVELLRTL